MSPSDNSSNDTERPSVAVLVGSGLILSLPFCLGAVALELLSPLLTVVVVGVSGMLVGGYVARSLGSDRQGGDS